MSKEEIQFQSGKSQWISKGTWDTGGRSPITEYPVQTPRSGRYARGSRAMSVPMTPSSSCVVLILVTCSTVTLCEHSSQPAPHHVGPINKMGFCFQPVLP